MSKSPLAMLLLLAATLACLCTSSEAGFLGSIGEAAKDVREDVHAGAKRIGAGIHNILRPGQTEAQKPPQIPSRVATHKPTIPGKLATTQKPIPANSAIPSSALDAKRVTAAAAPPSALNAAVVTDDHSPPAPSALNAAVVTDDSPAAVNTKTPAPLAKSNNVANGPVEIKDGRNQIGVPGLIRCNVGESNVDGECQPTG